MKEYSNDEIQAAKDFIWQHLQPHNKELAVWYATSDILQTDKKSVEEISLGYSFNVCRDNAELTPLNNNEVFCH